MAQESAHGRRPVELGLLDAGASATVAGDLPGLEIVRAATSRLVGSLVTGETERLDRLGLTEHSATLRSFLLGGRGKHMRALFCYWGWRGGEGKGPREAVEAVAAALELNHAAFLIHDDIIDRSDTRRGRPSVHHRFATQHAAHSWCGTSAAFGDGMALTLGDLCFDWARGLMAQHTPTGHLPVVMDIYHRMVTDACYGQLLEAQIQADRGYEVDRCRAVVMHKAARYMVAPSLSVGAALASADREVRNFYWEFGMALGEAYQLRDDLLGMFGDPEVTGKSNLDDHRDGKPTVLFATALAQASAAQRARLLALYGCRDLDSAGADELRALLQETGAAENIETAICSLSRQASRALEAAAVSTEVKSALGRLAAYALFRDR
ncbi:polyprenyl synthetase family protein [Streptomyces sp. URMC 127]|uniref:polyprenyl synthetase family protein n=1 Tax=Streptomyces sp. URMC 127 TaxID=3423402 RepID=UPI003F19882B